MTNQPKNEVKTAEFIAPYWLAVDLLISRVCLDEAESRYGRLTQGEKLDKREEAKKWLAAELTKTIESVRDNKVITDHGYHPFIKDGFLMAIDAVLEALGLSKEADEPVN